MAFVPPKDRVLERSSTSGSGPWTLGGAVDTSYNGFAASMSDGDTTIGFVIEPGVAFATGILTYTASGTTITLSTTFESKGTFGGGTKEIGMGLPASDAVYPARLGLGLPMTNGKIVESHSGNAVTFAIKTQGGNDPSASDPVYFFFRNATVATGDYVTRRVTAALSVTVASTKTLGTSSGVAFKVWLVAVDTGSGVELGVVNCLTGSGTFPLSESSVISPTATPANSAGVIYTTSGQTSKPFRKIGFAEYASGLATAGTWNASPSKLQLFGPGIHAPGEIVQRVFSITGAVASGTTVVPLDDTIPQNTEGDQYLTQAVTPQSAANLLEIHVDSNGSISTIAAAIMALFQDSTANALSACYSVVAATNYRVNLSMTHLIPAGTTSSTTFKVRIGPSQAGTYTLNGSSAARELGGVLNSGITVIEYQG